MNYKLLILRSMLMEYATVSTPTTAGADATLPGPLDWTARREKITRLYPNHTVKQIKKVMEDEDCFFAR